jgi:hypothetical protein
MTFTIFENGKEKKEWHTYQTKKGRQFIQIPCTSFEKAVELSERYFNQNGKIVQVFDEQNNLVYQVKNKDLFDI